ncbi:MAG: phosphoglycerate kinase [Candidatus Methanomethylicia archaeon]|jgi:phosphoglycerate kinase|nr:phosphoglycerate kinase [Candidatus Methanomethylicia archaeon]
MKFGFYTMDDFDFNGKKVLLRVDINSPIDPNTNEILDDFRIKYHVPTILELLDKGASITILAHQGRPGDNDFTTLSNHARLLSRYLNREVKYIEDIFGPTAKSSISSSKPGDIILLENVRFYSEEVIEKMPEAQSRTFLVRFLAPLFSIYINDAFATSHRSHPSLTGFPMVLPSCGGRLLEKEVESLSLIMEDSLRPSIFILGGGKVQDSLQLIEALLQRNIADKILLTGLVSHLFMIAKGLTLNRETLRILEGKGIYALLPRAQRLVQSFPNKIVTPIDSALLKNNERIEVDIENLPNFSPIYDIGENTVKLYYEIIKDAKVIVVRGPAGYIEDERFSKGSEDLLKCIINSKAKKILGGGHLRRIAEKLNIVDKIDYFSTGGGAFIAFLSGEKLPAIEALINSAKKFKSDKL